MLRQANVYSHVRAQLRKGFNKGSISVPERVLYGHFGAVRAECFLEVTGAMLPFTAVTRVQIPSGTPTFSVSYELRLRQRRRQRDQFVTTAVRFASPGGPRVDDLRELAVVNSEFLVAGLFVYNNLHCNKLMGTRVFSAELGDAAPENRTLDNDAPGGLRLEFVDTVFSLAETDTVLHNRITDTRLYRVLKQSMGLAMAPDTPMNGFRNGAARQVRDLPWQRVYDLICRWWREFPPELQGEYIRGVNVLLSSYRVVWDLGEDGQLHRVLPSVAHSQVDAAFRELNHPRFTAALASFREAMNAYDGRPQRGRDSCKNIFDALESVSKEVLGMPAATFGDVINEARRRQSMASETLSSLQKLYEMANSHFRHGRTTPFALKPAEVDFVVLSSVAGILLFMRL